MRFKITFLLASVFLSGSPAVLFAQHNHNCKSHKQSYNPWNSIPQHRAASVSVSDSIDLIKHTIDLDLTDFSGFTTRSVCTIDFKALVDNITTLPLDLKGQIVDSVIHASGPLTFSHANEMLEIMLPDVLNSDDNDQVSIYYHGGAVTDPSGFGGFYFNSSIAYNIGVAFSDLPPSYGRVWFPCFDNFVEKSTFEFRILTSGGRSAFCNGYLESVNTIGADTLLTTWIMDEEISSYLASVAVSNYQQTQWEFESITGNMIPVLLVGSAQNLPAMVNAFGNLETVFNAFENWFGYYRWPKVGYTLTPVGAMEHSTNIAFPTVLAGNNPQTEPVMAHELAHEWFGNLVTCATSQDMWLNEGWAEFLSILAYEAISGPEEYAARMRSNHRNVLHKAHFQDGDWLTMNNIPPELTYGEHVYNKGALMAHTLRGYLGDDLFFDAMKSYLDTFEFKNASSEDLRDHLNSFPGIDVTDYFNDWIFQPGWAQFSVDEFSANVSGEDYTVQLEIRQRLREAPEYYQNVPVTLSLMDENWNVHEQQIVIGGELTNLEVTAPFSPVFATLNRDEKLSWAVTAQEELIETVGFKPYNHAFAINIVQEIQSPARLRLEHNWVGPGGFSENSEYIVSPDRYWRVAGHFDNDFSFNIRLEFDGRNSINSNLDVKLFELAGDEFDEEQLVVLYRAHPSQPWTPWENIEIQTLGSSTNGHARLTALDAAAGEYTFGWPDSSVGIGEREKVSNLNVYPNPATDFVQIEVKTPHSESMHIRVSAADGRLVISESMTNTRMYVPVSHLPAGVYIVEIFNQDESIGRKPLVIR